MRGPINTPAELLPDGVMLQYTPAPARTDCAVCGTLHNRPAGLAPVVYVEGDPFELCPACARRYRCEVKA